MTTMTASDTPIFKPVTRGVVRQAKMEVMRCLAYWILLESVTHIIIAITSVAYLDSKTAIVAMIAILTGVNGLFSYTAFHRSHLLSKLVKYIKLSRLYEQSKVKCISQLEGNHARNE